VRILVLGGTVFLGRHVVEAAVAAGHDVVLFNRGRHNPELFPDLEKLRGDREGDVDALAGRTFDAVIDTSAYTLAQVTNILDALDGRVGHYTFVSSISAYAGFAPERVSEDAPVQELPEIPSGQELNAAYYGAQKAECERRVTEAFGEQAFVVRPGMIVGPEDPIDRYLYWLRRMDETGEVIAPGDPKSPIQVIDVRDLAGWIMSGVEQQLSGVFNATGPAQQLSRRDFLERSAAGIGSDAQLVWISDEFLLQHEVGPFEELPYWVPTNPDLAGFFAVDISRALHAGLALRPLERTARDTLSWDKEHRQRPFAYDDFGISVRAPRLAREREAELITSWRKCEREAPV
jgi:nucleoside-diphosphate-sugar epimerase